MVLPSKQLVTLVALLLCATKRTVIGQVTVDGFIDFPACWRSLHDSDLDGDGAVDIREYFAFADLISPHPTCCESYNCLRLVATFNRIACSCLTFEKAEADCCVGTNARVMIDGALVPPEEQTLTQKAYLTEVCKLSHAATASYTCSPSTSPSNAPSTSPSDVPSTSPSDVPTTSPSDVHSESPTAIDRLTSLEPASANGDMIVVTESPQQETVVGDPSTESKEQGTNETATSNAADRVGKLVIVLVLMCFPLFATISL